MVYSGPDLQTRTTVPNSNFGPNGTFEIVAEPFQIPSYFELVCLHINWMRTIIF